MPRFNLLSDQLYEYTKWSELEPLGTVVISAHFLPTKDWGRSFLINTIHTWSYR